MNCITFNFSGLIIFCFVHSIISWICNAKMTNNMAGCNFYDISTIYLQTSRDKMLKLCRWTISNHFCSNSWSSTLINNGTTSPIFHKHVCNQKKISNWGNVMFVKIIMKGSKHLINLQLLLRNWKLITMRTFFIQTVSAFSNFRGARFVLSCCFFVVSDTIFRSSICTSWR